MNETIKQALNFINNISDVSNGYMKFFGDGSFEITIQKMDHNKISVSGFNHKTDRFINLDCKKYSKLMDGLKSLSSDLYISNNRIRVTLSAAAEEKEEVTKVPAKVIGYCRVSSKKQLEGNGLESQKQEILSRYPNAAIKWEQYTGTKTDRPVFNEIVEQLQENDTLVVSKLDRLARNTVEGIQIVERLFKKGVAVHVLNVGLLENTTMGKFFLTTMLAVAEMERNQIIERTSAGKEVARQKENYTEGRPRSHGDKIEQALSMLSINGGDMSYKQVETLTGISKSTLIRRMRERK